MARKSGFARRSNRMVRETVWAAITPTDTAIASASGAVLFGGFSAAALALRPFTIVRTRGWIHVLSDQVAASESFGAVYTQAVVTDQALAAGVASVPTGDADRDSDAFFVFEEIAGRFEFISGIGVHTWAQDNMRYFDSKAMRKVEDGFDVAFAVEATAISSGVQIKKGGRMLLKLH